MHNSNGKYSAGLYCNFFNEYTALNLNFEHLVYLMFVKIFYQMALLKYFQYLGSLITPKHIKYENLTRSSKSVHKIHPSTYLLPQERSRGRGIYASLHILIAICK